MKLSCLQTFFNYISLMQNKNKMTETTLADKLQKAKNADYE